MKTLRVISLTASVLLSASCAEQNTELPFLEDSTPRILSGGKEILRYDADYCQLEHSATDNEFAIVRDDGSDYLVARLDKNPAECSVTVSAEISWIWGNEYTENKTVAFNIEKVEDHCVWLWNSSAQIGLVLRNLE